MVDAVKKFVTHPLSIITREDPRLSVFTLLFRLSKIPNYLASFNTLPTDILTDVFKDILTVPYF